MPLYCIKGNARIGISLSDDAQLTEPQPGWLQRVECASILPSSRTSTNWNDASTTSGPFWITLLLNVLLANGVSVYTLAFTLKADISIVCCKNDSTYYTFDHFSETITACRYSVIHLYVHVINALTAKSW